MTRMHRRPGLAPVPRLSLLPIALAAALTACGGGDDDAPATTPATLSMPAAAITGVFLDSAVEGLEYAVGNAMRSSTNAKGEFSCLPGERLSFSIGGVALGSANCAPVLTPLQLAGTSDARHEAVVNRLLALQMLDDDGDPGNGIRITGAVKAKLAGVSLDFSQPDPARFNDALKSALAAAGSAYAARSPDADYRMLAREHFEDTLASRAGTPVSESFTQKQPLGDVTVSVTRYQIQAADGFHIPYEGTDAGVKAEFPKGFLPSYGSALAFKGRNAGGDLEFYALTDRGPNGDGPSVPFNGASVGAKIFPSPSFAPAVGVVTVGKSGAVLSTSMPLKASASVKMSGLPIPVGSKGNSAEVPVMDAMKFDTATKAVFDANGLDTEAVAYDKARNALWVSDEYGPFIVKFDAATGVMLARYAPGSGLPDILLKRRANRGMEGLALDTTTDRLHGFLQSPLSDGTALYSVTGKKEQVERFAAFTRWVEFDLATGMSTRMFAYPIQAADYQQGRTGNAKLGDMVALGNGRFIVIEQGAGPDGKVFNRLMLVEIGNATDIGAAAFNPATSDLEKSSMAAAAVNGADWSKVVPLKKRLLLDLNAVGWMAEKAEGLTLVDDSTLALANDNDFGLKTKIYTPDGVAVAGADVTKCTVDAAGKIVTSTDTGCKAENSIRVARGEDRERPARLWLLKFAKPLSGY